jgi:hypothetical protein
MNIYSKLHSYLIKLYLLRVFDDCDVSLRTIFFITSLLLKEQSEEVKDRIVPRVIYLHTQLIKYKPIAPKTLVTIRKKLYVNIISKNL